MKYKVIKDKYLKARGGKYKIYSIYCAECKNRLFIYQKDGNGVLRRCYYDRMIALHNYYSFLGTDDIRCDKCKRVFGKRILYEKEKRQAIRLFVGAVYKRGVKL